jgi:TonB family protein
MHLLLESHERRDTPIGMAASIAIHVGLVGLIALAYKEAPARPGLVEQFVTFLIPPDRPKGQQGSEGAPYQRVEEEGEAVEGAGTTPVAPISTGPQRDEEPGGQAPSGDMTIDLPSILGDSIHTEIDVDSAVRRYEWSAAPDYPLQMLRENREGHAFVLYVVDTTGRADSTSLKVVQATHQAFVNAVREALPKMRFRPAILAGQKVPQLVQQNFAFKIRRPDSMLPVMRRPPL